jgi:hypothetical protein
VRSGAAHRIGKLRQPEVEHLDRAVVAHLDVGRLQVAMDDALLVCRAERVDDSGARRSTLRRVVTLG